MFPTDFLQMVQTLFNHTNYLEILSQELCLQKLLNSNGHPLRVRVHKDVSFNF
jgi:hypothetical protein